jgi:thioredoxin
MQEQVTESGPVVVEATDQNFLETVIEESKKRPVVVDLWASWCGPCRTLGPILERVAGEREGAFLLAKLDVDANPYTAGQFGVQSIPTVVAFRDGQPIDGFVGAIPEPMVNEFVDRLMPTEAELEAEERSRRSSRGTWTTPSRSIARRSRSTPPIGTRGSGSPGSTPRPDARTRHARRSPPSFPTPRPSVSFRCSRSATGPS